MPTPTPDRPTLAPYHVFQVLLPEGVDPNSTREKCEKLSPVDLSYFWAGQGLADGGVIVTLAPEATEAELEAVGTAFAGFSRDITYHRSTYLFGTITNAAGEPVDGTGRHE